MDSLGERIKYLRKKNSLTQDEFSTKTGVSRSNVSRIEKNEISPSATSIVQICTMFKITSDWLLFGEEITSSIIEETNTKPLETPVPFEEKMLLNNYRELIEENKEKLIETAILLRTEQNNKHKNNKQDEKNTMKTTISGFKQAAIKPLQLDPTPEDTEVTEELTPTKADLNFCQYQTYMNRIKK